MFSTSCIRYQHVESKLQKRVNALYIENDGFNISNEIVLCLKAVEINNRHGLKYIKNYSAEHILQ